MHSLFISLYTNLESDFSLVGKHFYYYAQAVHCNVVLRSQRVAKRCRLSLLTNSALVYESQCGGREGVVGSQSANEYSCAHHVTWSPNKLWRSTSIFNIWYVPMRSVYVICSIFPTRVCSLGGLTKVQLLYRSLAINLVMYSSTLYTKSQRTHQGNSSSGTARLTLVPRMFL